MTENRQMCPVDVIKDAGVSSRYGADVASGTGVQEASTCSHYHSPLRLKNLGSTNGLP